jgi:hypothetical protein
MNINIVLSNRAEIDPAIDLKRVKELGSFWGGWRTWRSCQTDNVICHDMSKARELIDRNFHATCNFYIPNSAYISLDRPAGVKLYEGTFVHDIEDHEDIVAMHLATTTADIVLLLGFNFQEPVKLQDRLAEHKATNYRNLIRQVMADNPKTQWVILDHPAEFRKDLQNLPNLGKDTLINILQA